MPLIPIVRYYARSSRIRPLRIYIITSFAPCTADGVRIPCNASWRQRWQQRHCSRKASKVIAKYSHQARCQLARNLYEPQYGIRVIPTSLQDRNTTPKIYQVLARVARAGSARSCMGKHRSSAILSPIGGGSTERFASGPHGRTSISHSECGTAHLAPHAAHTYR